ncbi:glutamate racemase [Clostridium tyrobutyricum]|uniref:glutamate racemase n=1 Tax=Clostridium tyrobutyricum TaxID=1519 RepID=UPI00057F4602|nr:glutamate racemase [Clostridium tyrobutyricum]
MDMRNRPIGFFDSGVGGISVLKQAVAILPNEDYVYFGDSIKAPYGVKNHDEIKKLTFDAVKFLLNKDIKALVVACNTATSVAIEDLRKKYTGIMPIVGIEPALKPAVEFKSQGKIIIMATPVTLLEDKFNNLMKKYSNKHKIQKMPCPGLVELIEEGITCGERVEEYLKEKFLPFKDDEIAAVVLGCTHYPFIKNTLSKVLNEMDKKVPIIDGSIGTVNQLKRQLLKYDIKCLDNNRVGNVKIFNSLNTDNIIKLSYKLLKSQ